VAAVWQSATFDPVAGDLFTCQGAIWARQSRHLGKSVRRTRRGQGIQLLLGGFGGHRLPAPRPVSWCVCWRQPNQKSRSLTEAALRRSRTCKSPAYTAESASMGGSSKAIAWPDTPCDVTQAAARPRWPSMVRRSRFHVASLCRMRRSIWMGTRFVNTDLRLFNYLATETRQ
jgi:hypothetical protein